MYIIFLLLFIVIIAILVVLDKLIVLFKSYEETTKAFVETFMWFRKRHEHLDEVFHNDLDILAFYTDNRSLELKDRIMAELEFPIIDDDCLDYKEKAITAIVCYQKLYAKYMTILKEHPLLSRLLALEELVDLSDLDFS